MAQKKQKFKITIVRTEVSEFTFDIETPGNSRDHYLTAMNKARKKACNTQFPKSDAVTYRIIKIINLGEVKS